MSEVTEFSLTYSDVTTFSENGWWELKMLLWDESIYIVLKYYKQGIGEKHVLLIFALLNLSIFLS